MEIESVEAELLELAEVLDKPYAPRGDPDSVAMAIGHRVRTLYRCFLTCTAAGLPPAAGRALLRPMVEANILLRFIREEPEWRSRLWQAESTRMWLGLAQQIHERPLPPEQRLGHVPTLEEISEQREKLAELRAAAVAAGVDIPPSRFLPDIQEQVQSLDAVETWQAYIVAYMRLTHDQHVAQGSFADAVDVVLEDGRLIHRETTEEEPPYPARLLASSLFASTLAIVSSWLELGVDSEAERIRREIVAPNAIREARSTAAKVEDGMRLVGRQDVTLAELRDAFETWATGTASTLAPSTRELYLLRLDTHVLPALGPSTKAWAVTPAHLRTMIDKLRTDKQSGSSVRGCVVATSALMRYAVRRGLNPVRQLERGDRPSGKRKTEPRYLDRMSIDMLLDELGDEFRPVAACCAFAGLRISEALALRWADVDLSGGMLNVPGTKTVGSAQPVPMTADMVRELQAHRRRVGLDLRRVRPDALLFPHDRRNALRAVYTAGDRAGLNPAGVEKIGLHDLRHSCAGLLFAANVPAPTIAAILRHADVRTTLTVYAGLVETNRAGLRGDLETAFGARVSATAGPN
jgi:integrase